jgi:hypothetical protein
VHSIADLSRLAQHDLRYHQMALDAAENLGGHASTLEDALRWLRLTQQEAGDDDGSLIVAEINDLVGA